jgi:hypothetical protein
VFTDIWDRQMAQSMTNNLSWGVGMLFFCLCLLFMQTETFHRRILNPCVFLPLPFVGAESLQVTLLESSHPLNTQKLDAARVVVVVASLPLAGHELFLCVQGNNPLCPVWCLIPIIHGSLKFLSLSVLMLSLMWVLFPFDDILDVGFEGSVFGPPECWVC